VESFKILGHFFLVLFFFFFFFQFCAGDSPQQDWARFGYRSVKEENSLNIMVTR
jgi:hypothetical protein